MYIGYHQLSNGLLKMSLCRNKKQPKTNPCPLGGRGRSGAEGRGVYSVEIAQLCAAGYIVLSWVVQYGG